MQEEQQELSDVFKVRPGLTTAERDQVDRVANEMDAAMTAGGRRRDDALRRHRLDDYATRHFHADSPPLQFTTDRLHQPLLARTYTVAERRASRRRTLYDYKLLTIKLVNSLLLFATPAARTIFQLLLGFINTEWARKGRHKLMAIILSNLNRFSFFLPEDSLVNL